MDWLELVKWVGGVIAAIVAGGLVFKLVVNRKNTTANDIRFTMQNHNKAGGDIIGGDSEKNNRGK